VTFSANAVTIDTPVTITATVTDNDAKGTTLAPAGTVTFTLGNSGDKASSGSCVLSPAGGATSSCNVTLSAANVGGGAHTVNISFPVDPIHTASSGGNTITINPAGTATRIISASNVQNFLGQSAGLTATVQNISPNSSAAPTGAVQFLLDGNPLGSPAVLIGAGMTTSMVTITDDLTKLTVGSHTITAQYVPDQVLGSQNFVKSDSGASGGGSNEVAITVAPTINNIPGQSIAPVQLKINSTGFSGQVAFSCNVQLAGNLIPPLQKNFPICALDHTSGTLPATVTATITTVPPTTSMADPAFSNPDQAPRVAGIFGMSMPLAGVLGLMVMGSARRKYWSRRKLISLLGVMMVLAVLMLVAGCGGGFSNPNNLVPAGNGSTQQGQYVVSVIGTDANGNTVAIAAIPLNVQP
jgi:hypothetical protein